MRQLRAAVAAAIILAVIMAPVAAMAQTTASFETLTVSSTSLGISSSVINTDPARTFCLFTLATDQVRWRVDGVAPTSSVGHIMDPGGELRLYKNEDIRKFRAIRVTNDAALSVTCE